MKKPLRQSGPARRSEQKPRQRKETAFAASSVSVRQAKSQLSALLDWVTAGHEVTITSNDKPKARLVPLSVEPKRKVFRGMGDFLRSQPIHRGPSADQLVREDRDGRGE